MILFYQNKLDMILRLKSIRLPSRCLSRLAQLYLLPWPSKHIRSSCTNPKKWAHIYSRKLLIAILQSTWYGGRGSNGKKIQKFGANSSLYGRPTMWSVDWLYSRSTTDTGLKLRIFKTEIFEGVYPWEFQGMEWKHVSKYDPIIPKTIWQTLCLDFLNFKACMINLTSKT